MDRASLKRLLKRVPTSREVSDLAWELSSHTDDTVALSACSLLDHALRDAIASKFVELTSAELNELFSEANGGALATLTSKIRLAYALGLFGPKTKSDLNILRIVRNAIAHAVPRPSFDTAEIEVECRRLQIIADADTVDASPREIFVAAATILISNIQLLADAQRRPEFNYLIIPTLS